MDQVYIHPIRNLGTIPKYHDSNHDATPTPHEMVTDPTGGGLWANMEIEIYIIFEETMILMEEVWLRLKA